MQTPLKNFLYLLPGYELDGFPRHANSAQAEQWLAAWVAMWHPTLIEACGAAPHWHPCESAPSDLAGTLVIQTSLATDVDSRFAKGHADQQCVLLETSESESSGDWQGLQQTMLQRVGLEETSEPLLSELRRPFAALGYAYLQIQLMTRQLRYTSNLDQVMFSDQLTSAAEHTLRGQREPALEMLQSCFDSLGQERDHYYSLDVQLLDVTLLAESTLGKSLARQFESLSQEVPANFLASAGLLTQLKERQPDGFQLLSEALQLQQACLIGGLEDERPHPLMNREALTRDFQRGRKAYRQLDLDPPKSFGRLSFGMTTDSPSELKRHGFEGAFLVAWSNGAYPEGSQAKLAWEASDGIYLSALSGSVLDASDASSFLTLGWQIGEALDHQHVPTQVFAHWPGQGCEFFRLLQIVSEYTPALGRWTTAERYFAETDQPYHQERLNANSFEMNWLAESDHPNALIGAVRAFHFAQQRCRSLQNLSNLAWQLEHARSKSSAAQATTQEDSDTQAELEATAPQYRVLETEHWDLQLEELQQVCDRILDDLDSTESHFERATELSDTLTQRLLAQFAKVLAPSTSSSSKAGAKADDGGPNTPDANARVMLNPRCAPSRIRVQSDSKMLFPEAPWNFATGLVGHHRYTCVDVPSTGFLVAPSERETVSPKGRQRTLAAAAGLLTNEFLETQIDVGRGNLRSLHIPARRGNRLSLMVARREFDQKQAVYSEMVAKDVRMLTSSNMCGLVRATGELRMDGKPVADFEIDYEIWRGSRILEVVIRLSKLQMPASRNPWRSAYVVRLAWPSEAAVLNAYNAGRRSNWSSGKAIAPELIEIDETDYRTHYLPGGLAFHRRTERRFLETILPSDSEHIEHKLGIAVDLPQPLQSAGDFIDQRYSKAVHVADVNATTGWFVHCNQRNVMVDLEFPLVDSQDKLIGVRLFLTECSGKSTSARIRLMHSVAFAQRVNDLSEPLGKLACRDDGFSIALRSHEQCCVDVLWG